MCFIGIWLGVQYTIFGIENLWEKFWNMGSYQRPLKMWECFDLRNTGKTPNLVYRDNQNLYFSPFFYLWDNNCEGITENVNDFGPLLKVWVGPQAAYHTVGNPMTLSVGIHLSIIDIVLKYNINCKKDDNQLANCLRPWMEWENPYPLYVSLYQSWPNCNIHITGTSFSYGAPVGRVKPYLLW